MRMQCLTSGDHHIDTEGVVLASDSNVTEVVIDERIVVLPKRCLHDCFNAHVISKTDGYANPP